MFGLKKNNISPTPFFLQRVIDVVKEKTDEATDSTGSKMIKEYKLVFCNKNLSLNYEKKIEQGLPKATKTSRVFDSFLHDTTQFCKHAKH